jgi:hypothetical protein
MRGEHRLRRRTLERRLPRQHLVAHHREGVNVGASVDVALPRRLLGRHIARRADRHPGVRQPAAAARLGQRPGHAEVGEDGMVLLQEDVFGFDVAMDHALGVRVCKRVGDLVDDANRVRDGDLALPSEPVPQRFTRHVRHDVVQQAVACPGGEYGKDVGVLEVRGKLDLQLESRGGDVARELGRQKFDDDLAMERGLLRQEEATHAASRELLLDSVGVAQGALEALTQARHRARRCIMS